MKAKWLAKSGFCTQVDKHLEQGQEYTGPDRIVQHHIDNGLAVEVKEPKKKPAKEKESE
jgi:hypothetical protein